MKGKRLTRATYAQAIQDPVPILAEPESENTMDLNLVEVNDTDGTTTTTSQGFGKMHNAAGCHHCSPCTSTAWWSSHSQQQGNTMKYESPGNDGGVGSGHSSPSGPILNGTQPSTPKSPASSSEQSGGTAANTPNPGTPAGNQNPLMVPTCNSPTYVSLSVDPDESTYVYMEGTEAGGPLYSTTSAPNGQTLYYGLGEPYDSTATHNGIPQQYPSTSSATSQGIAYTQENGVMYVVQTANHNHGHGGPITNNNSSGMTNLNVEHSSQLSVPNVTKVSPATNLKNQGKLDKEFGVETLAQLFGSMGLYDGGLEDRVAMIETCFGSDGDALVNFKSGLNTGDQKLLAQASFISAPITVQWLLQNYETAEGVSLPRSTLYFHYIRHCRDHKLDPVNAASFGKLIRSVFLGLRTRRLGTRGNSKYHYYGIRLKPDSPLNGIDESMIADFLAEGGFTLRANGRGIINPKPNPLGIAHLARGSAHKRYRNPRDLDDFGTGGLSSTDSGTIQHFLGDSSKVMDGLSGIKTDFDLPEGLTEEDVRTFGDLYLTHCANLLSDVKNFQLSGFQRRWIGFWRFTEGIQHAQILGQNELEARLPKSKLKALCTLKEIQKYVQETDTEFYQALADILVPEALRPVPSGMSNSIRNFAKGIDECLADVLLEYPVKMVRIKLRIVGLFSQALRRRTSLNHLAQAARAVLQNETQIKQMVGDLGRIDFRNIDEQASWVSGCNGNLVEELVDEFQSTLANHKSLEEWASWLETVVDKALQSSLHTDQYANNARLFLLKWSYYSSFVIRDLTLRSAASFGSFHLLRLLYDEFLYFIIENRVAKATGIPAIAILSKSDTNFFGPSGTGSSSGEEEEMSEA